MGKSVSAEDNLYQNFPLKNSDKIKPSASFASLRLDN
jgi:hypothetical protein